jgi:phage-related protein
VWNAISSFFSGIWDGISTIFHNVVQAVVGWLAMQWESIKSTASSIWNGITSLASTIWNNIVNAIKSVVEPIIGTLQGWWENIRSGIESAWNSVAGVVGGVWNGIKDAIVQPIIDAYNALTGWIGDIKSLVQGAWDTISGIVSNINTAISGAADAISEANTLSLGANNPFAPATATGGVFRPTPGGQLRTIAEAGQSERVEPLDPRGLSVRDLAWVDQLIAARSEGGSGGDVYVTVKIGDQELVGLIDTQVERSNSALARDVRNGRR